MLDLYKLAVEMADRMSARRGTANSFFLTINTALAALLGGEQLRAYVAAAGIVLAITWWTLLKSYRDLSRAKFDVILALEESLPAAIYTHEWSRLRREPVRFGLGIATFRSWLAQYKELGRVERFVPWVFVAIYIAEIIRQIAE